jgi:hypothetical protein
MARSRQMVLGAVVRELAGKALRDRGRELALAIREALPEEYGYVLVLRSDDSSSYFTDSTREEAIEVLEKVLADLRKR